MKSSSQNSVRILFNLPNHEKIFDDFGCALSDKIAYHGRLFITEDYLCFNSNILGLKTKVILALKNIKEIKKKKVLGLFNNGIDVIYNNSDDEKSTKIYSFITFSNRNISYKRISNVWKANLRSHNIPFNESDSENDDDEQETVLDTTSMLSGELSTSENQEEVFFPNVEQTILYESPKFVFKMTIETFYDKFIKDDCEFSFETFYKNIGHTEVTSSTWTELDEATKTRELNFKIKVTGTPFVNQTRISKIQTLKKDDKGIMIKSSSKSLDVPYSSYFLVEDVLEVLPFEGDKCVYRLYAYVNFIKSTMWKGKIQDKTKEESRIENEKWLQEVKNIGTIYEEYKKPKPSIKSSEINLTHGLEKNINYVELEVKDKIILLIKNNINNLLQNYKKDLFYICLIFIIIIYLTTINSKLNRILRSLETNIYIK